VPTWNGIGPAAPAGFVPARTLVGQCLTFWVATSASAKVRPSTLATYRGYVNNRLIPELGRRRRANDARWSVALRWACGKGRRWACNGRMCGWRPPA